jgi:hypothetical protein
MTFSKANEPDQMWGALYLSDGMFLAMFRCPTCKKDLQVADDEVVVCNCGRKYRHHHAVEFASATDAEVKAAQ